MLALVTLSSCRPATRASPAADTGAAMVAADDRGSPYRMKVNIEVAGDPSAFDGTQRHAFLAAFAKVAKLGYQIGDLHWDPGHYDASRGRATIDAIHRRPPSDRHAAPKITVDVNVDTYEGVAKTILALTKSSSFTKLLSEAFNEKEFAHETRFSEPDLLPKGGPPGVGKDGKKGGKSDTHAMRRIAMNLQLVGLTTSTFTEAKREQLLKAFGAVTRLAYVAGQDGATVHDVPPGTARSRGTVRINWASAGRTAVSTVVCGLEMRILGDEPAAALMRKVRSFHFRRELADQIADSPGGDVFGVSAEDMDTSDVREVLAGGATVELFSHRAVRSIQRPSPRPRMLWCPPSTCPATCLLSLRSLTSCVLTFLFPPCLGARLFRPAGQGARLGGAAGDRRGTRARGGVREPWWCEGQPHQRRQGRGQRRQRRPLRAGGAAIGGAHDGGRVWLGPQLEPCGRRLAQPQQQGSEAALKPVGERCGPPGAGSLGHAATLGPGLHGPGLRRGPGGARRRGI